MPQAPRLPNRPGSPPRLPITEDVVAPNAAHAFRPPSFDERATVPPPASARPRPTNPPPVELVSPVHTLPKRSATLVGMPAPPSNPPPAIERVHHEDGQRDSVVEAVNSASNLADELGARARALKAAEEETAKLRQQLDAEREQGKLRAKWEELALKLGGGVVTVIVALCSYIGWRVAQLEHKTETADEKAVAQKAIMDGLPLRVSKLEQYERAEKTLDDCQKSYIRSFAKRTTGYDITTLPDSTVVHWGFEGTKPNLSYFPYEQCLPPGTMEPRPPGAAAP